MSKKERTPSQTIENFNHSRNIYSDHQSNWNNEAIVELSLLCHVDAPMEFMIFYFQRTAAAIQKKISRLRLKPPYLRSKKVELSPKELAKKISHYSIFLEKSRKRYPQLFVMTHVGSIHHFIQKNILGRHIIVNKEVIKPLRNKFSPSKKVYAQDRWMKQDELLNYLRIKKQRISLSTDSHLINYGFKYILNGQPARVFDVLKLANLIAEREQGGRIYLNDHTVH